MKLDEFLSLMSEKKYSGHASYFNPWSDTDQFDMDDGYKIRQANLLSYLYNRLEEAKYLVIAEAPGWRGCKWSGIPMISERQIVSNKLFSADDTFKRSSSKHKLSEHKKKGEKLGEHNPKPIYGTIVENGFTESTATIVWDAIRKLDRDCNEFVLWNAFPFHPHPEGDNYENCAPSADNMYLEILKGFTELFPNRPIITVGEICKKSIGILGLKPLGSVTHPSYGKKSKFINDLLKCLPTKTP